MKEEEINNFIRNALAEDIGDGNHSSIANIDLYSENKAHLLIKDKGIIAGVELARMIFLQLDKSLEFKPLIADGKNVKNGDIGFTIKGNSISILTAERLVLNCINNMSAIATKTSYLSSLIKNKECKLLDTRKTTPLNRIIEKWAVRIGGGENHRFGLYDMIMIKDNHIDFGGGIKSVIQKTKKYLKKHNKKLEIIVEARNIEEVKEILNETGIRRILLDNFNFEDTKKAVDLIGNNCETESSGGITEETIYKYAECGVNYISVGALTQSLRSFDISLKAIKS